MRDILLLGVIFGSIPFILRHAWLGVLAWTWIGLMNPHRFGWGSAVEFPVAMIIGVTTLIALVVSKDRKGIAWNGPMVILAVLAVFYTVKTPFAWVTEDAWMQWKTVIKVLIFTFVITMLIHGEKRIKWLLLTIVLSLGVFYGGKGGVFVLSTGGQHMVQGPDGTFIGGNTHLAVALIMVLPLVQAAGGMATARWQKLGLEAAFWLTILAIIFTYSRGALLGLGIIFPFLFLRMKRKVLVTMLLVPAVAVGIALTPTKLFERADTIKSYEEDESAMQRIQAWGVAKNIALENPLFGAGFALLNAPAERWARYADFEGRWFTRARAAHSIYFQMLGEHGMVGLLLFLGLLGGTQIVLGRVRREALTTPGCEWLATYARALQIGLFGYMVSGAFVSLAYFDLLFTFVALGAVMQRELAERRTTNARTLAPTGPTSRLIQTT